MLVFINMVDKSRIWIKVVWQTTMKGDQKMTPKAKIIRAEIPYFMSAAVVAVLICVVGFTGVAHAAKTAKEIDASVDAAMDRFLQDG